MAARVSNFIRINLPKFLGSQVGKDPKNFINKIKKIGVIQVTAYDRVDLAS